MPLINLPVFSTVADWLGFGNKPKDSETTESEKEKIKVRYVLFFDGTLNNKFNTDVRNASDSRQKGRFNPESTSITHTDVDVYEKAGRKEQGSYKNDYTNIVSLYNAAEAGNDFPCYTKTIFSYIDGVGTNKLGDDDVFWGGALGVLDTGIIAKVENAIGEIIENLRGISAKKPSEVFFEKITFDLFGFSRGATSARFCVHKLLKEDTNLADELREIGYQVGPVDVFFVGLFDTVCSYMGLQTFNSKEWEKSALKLDAIRDAAQVVHLAAAEEHRSNFCLYNIKSAGGKGKQYLLPGVHADVGGGYNFEENEKGSIVFQGDYSSAQRDKQDLAALGWYQIKQLNLEYSGDDRGWFAPVKVTVTERSVKNAYRQIPLMMMAKEYEKYKFEFNSMLMLQVTSIINAAGLSEIEKIITDDFHRSFQTIDWKTLSSDKIKALRFQHLHFSAKWNLTIDLVPVDKPYGKIRERFLYDG